MAYSNPSVRNQRLIDGVFRVIVAAGRSSAPPFRRIFACNTKIRVILWLFSAAKALGYALGLKVFAWNACGIIADLNVLFVV